VSATRAARAKRRDPLLWWTVGPGLAYLITFFALPMALVAVVSVLEADPAGGVLPALSLSAYARALDPLYLGVLGRSAWLAALTTVISLAAAYPTAWAIRAAPTRWRGPLLSLRLLGPCQVLLDGR
jgi:spermidine/putrescine transport system permease protein